MNCTKCGEPNPAERVECTQCGEPLLDALDRTSAGPTAVSAPTRATPGAGSPALQPTKIAPRALDDLPHDFEITGSVFGSVTPARSGAMSATGERTLAGVFAGRYEILAIVGEGGMGRVYKARDRELDKVIALKTILGGGDSESVQRFKHELVLARKVTHKNVVRIFDLGEAEGIKFFTMEFIEGDSLKPLIRKRGKIPVPDAVELSRQVLGALQEAHAQGVIHRDLKPQNIMVDAAGAAHLMDFGIARSADTTGMTATGAVVGTPDYMSPEQVKGVKAGPPSDIFSFGVILYEMLTGDVPYHADTPMSKIVMRLTTKPRSPRELSREIPKYLEALVLKCMEVDPELRYKDVGAVLADLDRHHVDRSLTMRVTRAVVRRRGAIVFAAAAAVVALGAWWWTSRRPAAPPVGPVHTLAIVPFTNATGSSEYEWLRTGLPEMLVTDLSQSLYVRPVPGERVSRVLQEAGVAQQSRFDEAALESVSRLSPAQSVLSGQFVESGGKLRLDLMLRRAGTGVPVPLKVEAASGDVFAVVDEITHQVKEHLELSRSAIRNDPDRPLAEVSTASLEARRAYQAGLAEQRRGANKAALPLLKEATAKDANFAMAYAKLAEAYLGTGDREEARAASERAQALSDTAPLPLAERYQIHASAARVREDHETAAKSYAELAKLYPDDPDIQFQLGSALEAKGRIPEAVKAYEKAVALSPEYGAALVALGRTQVMSGQAEKAIRSLEDALQTKTFKDNVEGKGQIEVILGTAYRELAQFDKSIEHFTLCLDYRKQAGNKRGEAQALSNLGTVYRRQGQMEKALDAQKKALVLYKEIGDKRGESTNLVALAQIHIRAGNLDKALAAFRESMQIETERQDAVALANRLDHIAEIYRQKGQYDDAIVYLEQAKSHLAQSDEKREKAFNYNYIGLVRKAQGLYEPAVEAFLAALPLFQAVSHDEGVAICQRQLALIYSSQGRYGDAFNGLRQSLALYEKIKAHDVADVRSDLGRLLVTVGQPEEAEKELDAAEASGGHGGGHGHHATPPDVLFARAEILELRGRLPDAAKAYEDANVKANLSGQKEVAVLSRIELGRLYLDQGKLENAERLLLRTRQEAAQARLRPLESQALAGLAEVHLARGDAQAARKAALEAVSIAETFSGRPTIYRASATLGAALERLKRAPEAGDAYAKAAATLEWIRGSLLPEHAASFVARADVQAFMRRTVAVLEASGRTADAAPLKKWLSASAPAGS